MSKEEDFACDNFAPQKWRKDICRNCYQVIRLHKKKEKKPEEKSDPQPEAVTPSSKPVKPSVKPPQPKEGGYVKQLIQQDIGESKDETASEDTTASKKTVPSIPTSTKIPTKPLPPPAPKPGPRTSSLKRNQLPPTATTGVNDGSNTTTQHNTDVSINTTVATPNNTPQPPRPKPKPGPRTSSLKRNKLPPNASTGADVAPINDNHQMPTLPSVLPVLAPCTSNVSTTSDNVNLPVPPCQSDTSTTDPQMDMPTDPELDLPTSEPAIDLPTTDTQMDTPTTDPQMDTPTTDPQMDTPTTDPQMDMPTTDPQMDMPTDPELDLPTSEPAIDLPTTDTQMDTPTTDPQMDTPTTDPQMDTPTTDPQMDTPTTDPQMDTSTTDPQLDTPTTDPQMDTPTTDPQMDMPTDPELDLPTSEPAIDLPTTDTQMDTPTTDPQMDTSTDPELDLPTTDPQLDLPTTDPELDLPTTDPQMDTPTTDPEIKVGENVPLPLSLALDDPTGNIDVDNTTSIPDTEPPSLDLSNNEMITEIEQSTQSTVQPIPSSPTPTQTTTQDLLVPLEEPSDNDIEYAHDTNSDTTLSDSGNKQEDSMTFDQSLGMSSAASPSIPFSSTLPPPPPPPPPLPPIESSTIKVPNVRVLSKPTIAKPNRADLLQQIKAGSMLRSVPLSEERTPIVRKSTDRAVLLEQIKSGPKLRSVPLPVERTPSVEKVTDITSELKQRVLKLRKKENEAISSVIVEKRAVSNTLCQQLIKYQGRKTYLHNLVDMLKRMDEFVTECNLSPEVMEKKMNWPLWLVEQLRNVIKLMTMLDSQIVDVEKLCKDTMESQQLNVEKVQRCVTNVIFTVRNIKNDLSRETSYTSSLNVFPVDDIDIHRFLKRAVESVTPLLDKLYEKALYSHSMVSDPSVGKFDLNFRLQNSIRLLRMCCQMTDTLMTYLDVQRHQKYSEAMLKATELDDQYKRQLSVLERKGEWDANQEVELKPSYSKRSPSIIKEENTLVDNIIDIITNGGTEEDIINITEKMTVDVFLRAEVKLLKVALYSCQIKMIDAVMVLRNKLLKDEAKKIHEFDWLHEAVQKANHECLTHLVTTCKLPINCRSADAGNTVLHIAGRRQDWSTLICLIKLGADPLLVNSSLRSAIQLLALKCFPPQHFPQVKTKELPFSLSSYINNQSLSDAKLVSNEGDQFYVHRLVLCGQSPVFRSMLESDLWAKDRQDDNKITLPNINSRTLRLLLQYLYTGESTFPHDDLNSWIELLSAADEFLLEPLRQQCEKVLSQNIDSEVVIPLLYGSHRCSAKRLLVNCCNYILENYKTIPDTDNEALLYILDNALDMMPKQ